MWCISSILICKRGGAHHVIHFSIQIIELSPWTIKQLFYSFLFFSMNHLWCITHSSPAHKRVCWKASSFTSHLILRPTNPKQNKIVFSHTPTVYLPAYYTLACMYPLNHIIGFNRCQTTPQQGLSKIFTENCGVTTTRWERRTRFTMYYSNHHTCTTPTYDSVTRRSRL